MECRTGCTNPCSDASFFSLYFSFESRINVNYSLTFISVRFQTHVVRNDRSFSCTSRTQYMKKWPDDVSRWKTQFIQNHVSFSEWKVLTCASIFQWGIFFSFLLPLNVQLKWIHPLGAVEEQNFKKTFRWLTILEIYEKSRHKWFGLQLKIMKVVEICENCSNVLPNEATEWSHCRKKPLNIITASGSLVCLYFVTYQYDDWFWMNKMLRTSYNNQLVQSAW